MSQDRQRVTRALDALAAGMYPYVEKELKAAYNDTWLDAALASFRGDRGQGSVMGEAVRWDAHAILTVMWDQWNRVFRHKLSQQDRSIVSELREYRNQWAHQAVFSFDDTYRILDNVERLLKTVDAPEVESVTRDKDDVLRDHFGREARSAYRKTRLKRQKWQDFGIYFICCLAIDFVILNYFPDAWFVALFVVFVFAYLAYQRLNTPMQLYFGPHECHSCGKIIYGDSCPYCEKGNF